jgi:hypothetical protein
MLKHPTIQSHPPLAITGRRNPDRLVSSVVDLRMYVIAIALGEIQ